jgi:hypothetical protein
MNRVDSQVLLLLRIAAAGGRLSNLHTKWARGPKSCIVEGSKKHKQMSTPIFSLSPEMQATWDDIMGQMMAFVNDTNADIDMAYDWVCEMLDIDSFVDNEGAWNSFYSVWESCDNRNDLRNIYID